MSWIDQINTQLNNFFGITFDQMQNFRAHSKTTRPRLKIRNNILKCLSDKERETITQYTKLFPQRAQTHPDKSASMSKLENYCKILLPSAH